MLEGKILKAWIRRGKKIIACDRWCVWHEKKIVPHDVPKGHMVVYVGEHYKRFVIQVSLLNHPLFQALLDQAKEVYDFDTDSRLRIPCDENIFLNVVQCAKSPPDRRLSVCL